MVIKKKPFHVAIIMDGNGRWAQNKNMPRTFGHKKGMATVKKIISYSNTANVDILSLFAFSTENWKRPQREIKFLFSAFADYLERNKKLFIKENIRLTVSGRRQGVSSNLLKKIDDTVEATKDNKSLILNVAFNYGGRAEIIDATKDILEDCKKGILNKEDIDHDIFKKYLYCPFLSDVDLLIRTSGEKRISNFLLWRIAYSEIYFTSTLWPDFTSEELAKAIEDYHKRERRFGAV